MKKVFAMILTVAMLCCAMAVPALADENPADNIDFEVSSFAFIDGTACINGALVNYNASGCASDIRDIEPVLYYEGEEIFEGSNGWMTGAVRAGKTKDITIRFSAQNYWTCLDGGYYDAEGLATCDIGFTCSYQW